MITKDNFVEVINILPIKSIRDLVNSNFDFIKLEVHITNIGATASIEGVYYDEQEEQNVIDNGNLYTDYDSFCNLCNEFGIDFETLCEN